MISNRRIAAVFSLIVLGASGVALGQTCRTSSVTGGSSTVTFVQGSAASGTSLSNADAIDGVYYVTSDTQPAGILVPGVRTMLTTYQQSGGGEAIDGAVFSNPTNAAITITRFEFQSDADIFTSTINEQIAPTTGWTFVSARILRWTGSVTVPAHSGAKFILGDSTITLPAGVTSRVANVVGVATDSASVTYSSSSFAMTVVNIGGGAGKASQALTGFDNPASGATYSPSTYVASIGAGANALLSVRVRETKGAGVSSGINTGLRLTLTIPAGWSTVTASTVASPWDSTTVSIVQPTSTTNGSFTVVSNKDIKDGSSTPAGSLVIGATAPTLTSTNLFPFAINLDGLSNGGSPQPVRSKNDGVVQVLGTGIVGVNTEFRSATIGSGPVRQLDFRADFNVVTPALTQTVNVDVFNNLTSSWTNITSLTVGSTNVTVTKTFTSDFEPYLDGSNRMRVRFVSTSGVDNRDLRFDALSWTMTLGYTVNNATGFDTNSGNVAHPFATIGKAASVVGASGAVYVDVGNSQSGTPYDHDVSITSAGTSSCPTLIQGVANGGQLPLVRGVVPSVDSGILIGANYVQVDGFQVENTNVGLYSSLGFTGTKISNSFVKVPSGGYGVLVYSNSSSSVVGNRVEAQSASAMIGVWDYAGSSNTLDGNKISGFTSGEALATTNAASPTIQRNIARGNYIGIHFAGSTGTVSLYNNTADSNTYLGVYSERSGGVTSRNNIISNNGIGWGWDSIGSVSTNYDDVFNNTNNYNYHGLVVAGPNNISANPNFIQTGNPAASDYYKLSGGSPCGNAGTNVGLPFLGSAPDIGAVESF